MEFDFRVIADFISSVGLPAALLIGLLLGLYKILKPMGERMIALHAAFLDNIIGEQRETKTEVKEIHGKVDKIHKRLEID